MSKLSNTNQRRVILEELRKLKCHPTADELYQIVRERLPRISLGTVYRNLELMSQTGDILKLATSGNQRRFDGTTEEHLHLRCELCGAVEDLDSEEVRTVYNALKRVIKRHDRISGYNLEFHGTCAKCMS